MSIGLTFFYPAVRIDKESIHYQFFPIHWSYRQVPWASIAEVQVVQYDALGEYAGWGGANWPTAPGAPPLPVFTELSAID